MCLGFFSCQVILELRERPDRAAKSLRGLTLSLQPLRGFDFDSLLSPPATPDTQLDAETGGRTPLPGPAPRPGPAPGPPQGRGPRREVFVWQTLSSQSSHWQVYRLCTTLHRRKDDLWWWSLGLFVLIWSVSVKNREESNICVKSTTSPYLSNEFPCFFLFTRLPFFI